MHSFALNRRTLIRSAALGGGGLALSAVLPAWARSGTSGLGVPMAAVSGERRESASRIVLRTTP